MHSVAKQGLRAGLFFLIGAICASGQTISQPDSHAAAAEKHPSTNPVVERVLTQWPEGRVTTVKHPGEWSYEEGVLLDGMIAEWRATGDGSGRLFMKQDSLVAW